jgi:hypothetical protein
MKNYMFLIIGILLSIQTFSNVPVSCGNVSITNYFELNGIPVNNFCGLNGTVEHVVEIAWAEPTPNETIDLTFDLDRVNSSHFELVSVTGVDVYSVQNLGSQIRISAELEMTSVGYPNATYAEVRFIFNWQEHQPFNNDFWFNVYLNSSSTACHSDYWSNIVSTYQWDEGTDFIFYTNIVEDGSPPLSQRTQQPAGAMSTFGGDLQIQGDFIVDQDYHLDGHSVTKNEMIICEGQDVIVTNNSLLEITDYIISGYDGRWGSIIVESGSELEIS